MEYLFFNPPPILQRLSLSLTLSLPFPPFPSQHPARPKLPDPFQPKTEIEVTVAKGNNPLSMHLGK